MNYTFLLIYNIEDKETLERFELEVCMIVQDFILNQEGNSYYWAFNSMLNKKKLVNFLEFICNGHFSKNDRIALYDMGLDEDEKTLIVGDQKLEDWVEKALVETYPARRFLKMIRQVIENERNEK